MLEKKGQTFMEWTLGFIGLFLVSIVLMILTVLFFRELLHFFVFLGWLFLILSVLGITHTIRLEKAGIAATGSASAVFFFLSWIIPKAMVFFSSFA